MMPEPMDEHHEVVESHQRFLPRTVAGELWSFDHLDAIAFKSMVEMNPGQWLELAVVVLFSNHCFTRSPLEDESVQQDLLWSDARERRVLCPERYALSRLFLPRLILELPDRHIQVADERRPNFMIFEVPQDMGWGEDARYAVFFEVERDKRRKKRMLLRVQSAYLLPKLSKRQIQANKIRFQTLLKRAYAR